ncbi:hypothetical protein POVCU2_0066270 [Plasmodium ovale curtisi]|uniref:Uncharacterized protein n=1 Tax=Plasmodium ovale curtisi TaxID=864141 RepID=A0A1A8VRD0_PLAOA|nr:hypothetical protein POVCU1_006830 [Plasmodium ovale curtisi]SBS91215.1 hypothetical protein POVCU2_0066270 [Plasmodium ovale curtisi]
MGERKGANGYNTTKNDTVPLRHSATIALMETAIAGNNEDTGKNGAVARNKYSKTISNETVRNETTCNKG